MRVLHHIVLSLTFCSLIACKSGAIMGVEAPELLHYVCSDALIVSYCHNCSELLSDLNEDNPFSRIELGDFNKSEAALATSYLGNLVNTLIIQVKSSELANAEELVIQAANADLSAEFFPSAKKGKAGVVIITSSEAQISAYKRHITEGQSIFDVPYFEDAASLISGKSFTIYRCANSARYIPKDFLQGVFPLRDITHFCDSFADWIVFKPVNNNCTDLYFISQGTAFRYSDLLSSQKDYESKLAQVLLDDCDFSLSAPLDVKEFRALYEKFVDSAVRLNAYRRKLQTLKMSSGKDPLKWELERAVKELALVQRNGEKLILLRTEEKADYDTKENSYPSFVAALYGSAFALKDDSSCAGFGEWTIIGSEQAVQDYLSVLKLKGKSKVSTQNSHLSIRYSGKILDWSKKGIRLWNLNQ